MSIKNNEQNMKRKVVSGLFWKFGERITAQSISLIVSILLARMLEPSDYGAIALIMIFITLANVFVSSGFGNALIQKKETDNLDFSSVFYINIAVSLVIYVFLFLCAPVIANFYDISVLSPALRVLAIRIPIAAVNSIQQAYVSRNMLFKRFFWSTLFGTLISGIIGVYMAYHGFGIWALVIQYLSNTCIDTMVLWFTVKWRPIFKCSWKRASKLISYGWKLLVSGLIDSGYSQLRSLVIGKIYTPSDLAFYNQGDKYPSLIVTNVNTSISAVFFPAISKFQDEKNRVKQMTRRAIQISAYVMWPLMIGLAVIAEPVIRLVLTEKWLPCVPFLRIFCLSYGLYPIHTANLQALNAIGRSDLFLKLEIEKKLIGLIALFLTVKYGPFAIAISFLITGIIGTFINSLPNKKLISYSYKEQIADLAPPLIISLLMAIIIYPISLAGLSDIITIILQIAMGGTSYFIVSKITNQKSLEYILNSLRKIKEV